MKSAEDFEFEMLERRINRDFNKIFSQNDKPVNEQNALDIADRAYFAGKSAGIAEAEAIAKMQKPVAWRHNHFGTWHYMDENDPFPADGWEPLYLRSSK